MKRKEHAIGFEVRVLANLIKREFHGRPVMQDMGNLTGTHGWIIGWLYEHRDKEIYQKDFENEFHIRRSTATGILKLMERNGLIVRTPVAKDGRLKRLNLTDKAAAMQEEIMREILALEKKMQAGIPPEDLAVFFRTVDKIKENLGEDCCGSCRCKTVESEKED